MPDIRKWFMKSHDKGNANASNSNTTNQPKPYVPPANSQPQKAAQGCQESSGRRKTSKYFSAEKQKPKGEKEELPNKRKQKENDELVNPPPLKKIQKGSDGDNDDNDDGDNDFVMPRAAAKKSVGATPSKKLKGGSGKGVPQKSAKVEESEEDDDKDDALPPKSAGRGRGGRVSSVAPAGGRGRGGFMNFGERKEPPNKGQKEIPQGTPDCLAGLTFVISGTLDSLEREEAEDLIKRHGGRVTGSVSKKTNYLLCDEDIGGRKSAKAKELGTAFLAEDGLFDMIRASKPLKVSVKQEPKKTEDKASASLSKGSPQKVQAKKTLSGNSSATHVSNKSSASDSPQSKTKAPNGKGSSLIWTEKYRPKVPNDMVGNQALVKQLHDWLANWNEQFLDGANAKKGKKQSDSGAKKAVLLSGTPGIGKTTSAKLVSQMLGFQAIEVNASDNRGKADSKIEKGISGSSANSIKELVSNEALSANMDRSKHPKTVLIMDEVDGMSAGDRGGVADLIASIKTSKIPIICICNDRYSQKLKSLVNYCLLLTFRKPTKQQMAKRLMQVAKWEGLQVNEIALEELAERVNGDMRMALNHLQYMSLSISVIKYDDIRHRLLASSKDEDISPFTAVDKLFGFNAGRLKMDERIDLGMSDLDLVPLLIQENYINYRPSSTGKEDSELKRMNLIAQAAESIADGDIVNVQIRRYRQWQLSQISCVASSITPASLLHGQREILEQGERNYNRFGGWLGKNSTIGKNIRLLEDLHVHVLASRESSSGRETLRLEYLTLLLKRLTEPLRTLPKDEAVEKVVDFMNEYSISHEDFDTVVELSKFKGHSNPLDGVQPAVKAALTKAYKEKSKMRMVKAADLVTLPGVKKAPKKRIAAILEPPPEGVGDVDGEPLTESEEESSDTEESDGTTNGEKLQQELQSLNSKATQVQLDLKGSRAGTSSGKNTSRGTSRGRGRGRGGSTTTKKESEPGSGSGSKRKR